MLFSSYIYFWGVDKSCYLDRCAFTASRDSPSWFNSWNSAPTLVVAFKIRIQCILSPFCSSNNYLFISSNEDFISYPHQTILPKSIPLVYFSFSRSLMLTTLAFQKLFGQDTRAFLFWGRISRHESWRNVSRYDESVSPNIAQLRETFLRNFKLKTM